MKVNGNIIAPEDGMLLVSRKYTNLNEFGPYEEVILSDLDSVDNYEEWKIDDVNEEVERLKKIEEDFVNSII